MIEIKTGDIFEEFHDKSRVILCHGCNCCNTMGAGIAKYIADNYPEAKEADEQKHSFVDSNLHEYNEKLPGKLSHTNPYLAQDFRAIVNLYTQRFPGQNFEYELLHKALDELSKVIIQYEFDNVLFPAIGCGIGGGNFYLVIGIISKWYKENFVDKNIDLNISIFFPQ